MSKYICLVSLAVILIACVPAATEMPTVEATFTPTSSPPPPESLAISAGLSPVSSKSVEFYDTGKTEVAPGNVFQSVVVTFELSEGTYTTFLDLDRILLIDENGTTFPAITLSKPNTSGIAIYYKRVGEDGRKLDFGLGFTDMDLTFTILRNDENKIVSLLKYHGGNSVSVNFLFEIPESSKMNLFQLMDLFQKPLD